MILIHLLLGLLIGKLFTEDEQGRFGTGYLLLAVLLPYVDRLFILADPATYLFYGGALTGSILTLPLLGLLFAGFYWRLDPNRSFLSLYKWALTGFLIYLTVQMLSTEGTSLLFPLMPDFRPRLHLLYPGDLWFTMILLVPVLFRFGTGSWWNRVHQICLWTAFLYIGFCFFSASLADQMTRDLVRQQPRTVRNRTPGTTTTAPREIPAPYSYIPAGIRNISEVRVFPQPYSPIHRSTTFRHPEGTTQVFWNVVTGHQYRSSRFYPHSEEGWAAYRKATRENQIARAFETFAYYPVLISTEEQTFSSMDLRLAISYPPWVQSLLSIPDQKMTPRTLPYSVRFDINENGDFKNVRWVNP